LTYDSTRQCAVAVGPGAQLSGADCGMPPPGIGVAGTPHLGNVDLRLEVAALRPISLPVLWVLGSTAGSSSVAGCTLLVVPEVTLLASTNANGLLSSGIPVPADPRL